ncbi:hypothetical protein LX36DRAFT_381769 [Colletotrichum falcatum]|nr:hypothetical protein LX36DRAFT_381769 [Colletotrichum falcatum]
MSLRVLLVLLLLVGRPPPPPPVRCATKKTCDVHPHPYTYVRAHTCIHTSTYMPSVAAVVVAAAAAAAAVAYKSMRQVTRRIAHSAHAYGPTSPFLSYSKYLGS